jgi:hypothetical protein
LVGLWRSFTDYSRIHVVTAANWRDPSTYEYGDMDDWQNADVFDSTGEGPLLGPTEDPYVYLDQVGSG